MNFKKYDTEGFFDELFDNEGKPRDAARLLVEAIEDLPKGDLRKRQSASERAMLSMGITFNVYVSTEETERTMPFDIMVPTPFVLMLRPRSGAQQWIAREEYKIEPNIPAFEFTDHYGNLCQRLIAPPGVSGV